MQQRAKPDTLFRLLKLISPSQFERLGEVELLYQRLSKKNGNSKRWKLIEYYWNAKSWSRAEELDIFGDRLDALKSRALKWMIVEMGAFFEDPATSMYRKIQGIRLLTKLGDNSVVYEEIRRAKKEARNSEAFSSLIEILQLELELIVTLPPSKTTVSITQSVLGELHSVKQKLSIVDELVAIRATLVKQYQIEYINSNEISKDSAKAIKQAITPYALRLTSDRSKCEFGYLMYFVAVHEGRLSDALDSILQTIQLFEGSSWLRENNFEEYYKNLGRAIVLAADQDAFTECKLILEKMGQIYSSGDLGSHKITEKYIKGLLVVSEKKQDPQLSLLALEIFESEKEYLNDSLKGQEICQIHFLRSLSFFMKSDFASCRMSLNDLWQQRKFDKSGYHIYGRVLELMCLIAIGFEEDELNTTTSATSRYIGRQQSPFHFLIAICKVLARTPTNSTRHTILYLENYLSSDFLEAKEDSVRDNCFFFDIRATISHLVSYIKTNHQL